MARSSETGAVTAGVVVLAACLRPSGPSVPRLPPAADQTFEVGRTGFALRGVAGDGSRTFVALTATGSGDDVAAATGAHTVVEAHAGSAVAWRAELAGAGGPMARAGTLVFAASRVRGTADGRSIHGEPGAMVAALDAATGTPAWRAWLDGDEWALVTAIAGTGDGGCIVGGTFSGTLRVDGATGAPRIVTAANRSDGFVARLTATGDVAWLVRFGGLGADAVAGLAVAGDRVALTGTFAAGAELGGETLHAFDDDAPFADAVVAELDLKTGTKLWAQSFGGSADDEVGGVAIDTAGRVVVAATARGVVHVSGRDLVVHGDAAPRIAWWSGSGAPGPAVLLGSGAAGARGVTTVGEHAIVAGFYRAAIAIGARNIVAAGADAAFAAELDASGGVVRAWPIDGPGREDVVAVGPVPGGFVLGVDHTATVTVDVGGAAGDRGPARGCGRRSARRAVTARIEVLAMGGQCVGGGAGGAWDRAGTAWAAAPAGAWGRAGTAWARAGRAWERAASAWERTNPSWGCTNPSWGCAGTAWGRAGTAWDRAGRAWGRAGSAWERAGSAWERTNPSWERTNPSWACTNPSWGVRRHCMGARWHCMGPRRHCVHERRHCILARPALQPHRRSAERHVERHQRVELAVTRGAVGARPDQHPRPPSQTGGGRRRGTATRPGRAPRQGRARRR